MTIRLLENGDYRLNQAGCIRDLQQSGRVLENGSLRQQEDRKTRLLQDAIKQSKQTLSCCQQYEQNCILQACGLSIESYMSDGHVYTAFAHAICCGNYGGPTSCSPWWTADISVWVTAVPLFVNPECFNTGLPNNFLPCGVVFKAAGIIGPTQINLTHGDLLALTVYVWNLTGSQQCTRQTAVSKFTKSFIAGG